MEPIEQFCSLTRLGNFGSIPNPVRGIADSIRLKHLAMERGTRLAIKKDQGAVG